VQLYLLKALGMLCKC